LVGTVGIEVYPPYGLLRSFVLKKEVCNLKISLQMIEILLQYAASLALKEVYLFAKETSPFLMQMGFSKIAMEELPYPIVQSLKSMGRQGIPMVYTCLNTTV
jgi:amino-acid N-acetyltransferase